MTREEHLSKALDLMIEWATDCGFGYDSIPEESMKVPCNTHELKILPKWFEDVQSGKKNFEIRKNDRNYQVGDFLMLKEWNRGRFTDRYLVRQIEYIYHGIGDFGLSEGYCVLGISIPKVKLTTENALKGGTTDER